MKRRIIRMLAAIGVTLTLLSSTTAYAACYTVNLYYYN